MCWWYKVQFTNSKKYKMSWISLFLLRFHFLCACRKIWLENTFEALSFYSIKWFFFLVSDSSAFIIDVDCLNNKKVENTWLSVLWKNTLCKIIIPYSHKPILCVFSSPLNHDNDEWPKGNILRLCQTKYWIAFGKKYFS